MFKKIIQTQFHLLSLNLSWTVSSLILLPVYVSYLSPSEYGIIAILMVIIALGNFISTANLNMGYTAFYFDVEVKNRLAFLHQIVNLAIFLISIYLIIGTILVFQFNLFIDETIPSFLILLTLVIAAQKSLQGIYNIYLQHEKKNRLYSSTNGTIVLINLLLQLLFLIVFNLGIYAIPYALAIAHLVGLFICMVKLKHISLKLETSFKPMLIYAISLLPFLLSEWLVIRGDRILVQDYFDFEQTGIYALTFNIAFLLSSIGTSFFNAARPDFFNYLKKINDFKQVLLSKFSILLLVMLSLGSIGIYILSLGLKFFVNNNKYLEVENYILLALLIICIRVFIRFLSEIFIFLKKHIVQNLLSISNALFFLSALFVLFPFSTIKDIMYALLISNFMTLVVLVIVLSNTTNEKYQLDAV